MNSQNCIYVPGYELFISASKDMVKGTLQIIPCGPVNSDGKIAADPAVVVTNDPPRSATVGKSLTYTPAFTKPAGAKSIVFKLKRSVDGMSIDESTGRLAFTPTAANIGKFDISIVVNVDGVDIPVLNWTIEVGL